MPVEIERKFQVAPGARVPELTVVTRGETARMRLHAVYFDTPELALANARLTLRRRTGGHDAGWHLKRPGDGDARTEVRHPLTRGAGSMTVPRELRARIADVVGNRPLLPVVDLVTQRSETQLLGPRGGLRALLADDAVTAEVAGESQSWREVEVELAGTGDIELLDAIATELAEHGVDPADHASKLMRALGGRDRVLPTPKAKAVRRLHAYLVDQVGALQSLEHDVLAGDASAIHASRIAIRRLRSSLKTFRPLFDETRTEPLREELGWFAGVLGTVRDADVVGERLQAALAELAAEDVVGPVRARIAAEQETAHREGLAVVRRTLDSTRYRALTDALVALVSDPELVPRGRGGEVATLVGRASEKPYQRWRGADAHADEAAAMRLRHDARKRAKAARYAWEAAGSVLPKSKRAARRWKRATQELGVLQDSVVGRHRLLELAAAARRAGEPEFTYGVLSERERAAGERAVRRSAKALRGTR